MNGRRKTTNGASAQRQNGAGVTPAMSMGFYLLLHNRTPGSKTGRFQWNRFFLFSSFFYDSSFPPHLIIIGIESFHWIFLCRVCSLKKISGFPLCVRSKERNCFGNENELMIVRRISWTQNAICPSKWTIGCLSKAIQSW